MLVFAAFVGTAGMVVLAFASDLVQFLVGVTLVSGVSVGAIMGTYIAFGIAVMRDRSAAARNLGVINIAVTLPFSVIPFIAPLILGIGGGASNYVALLVFGGVLALLGTLPLLGIRNAR